ncbi:MAG: NADH-quinone oxidoreductase subunit L [Streptosporangiales bacterium]|nr:NADH-quinone oxidoreductase subunit L [Streptosporangiales bacterium]MBO0891547.1 NADH-quinone oxidoreductase subunit L [Acidothermales bacterium]
MTGLASAVVALPLLAALVGWVPRLSRPLSALTAVVGTGVATALAIPVWVIAVVVPTTAHESGVVLTPTGALDVFLGVRVDGLSATVAVLVCFVALAVQVYSVGHLRREASERYRTYAGFISLFTAAMLLVVFSADLIVLLVGWEVMGICSYVLIGHYWERPDYSRAGVKAFLVTKLGDVPFLFGIFALGMGAHSFRVQAVLDAVPRMPHGTLYAGTLLLLFGVIGKSAQFPLHVWLPDAMAGPSPVSALIHAATMVAAGAYLVARLYPAFLASPPALAALAVVAAVTMLGSACAALAQDDLKRLLAYSTISQLGYMQAALATGGYTAGVTHLLAHGAFKALLFLAAGVVIARLGTNLMPRMGGLRTAMPVTFATMTVGYSALVGLPPTSGFFSKDAVLDQVWNQAMSGRPVVPHAVAICVLASALLTVLVTAAYATRALLLTFFGYRNAEGVTPSDAGLGMSGPLIALAVPSLLLGFLGLYRGWLPSWVGSAGVGQPGPQLPYLVVGLLSFVLLVLGAATVALVWNADPSRDPVRVLGPVRRAFAGGFGVDALYERVFVRGTAAVARGVVRVDAEGIDATAVDSGRLAQAFGAVARRTQTGNAQWYVTGVLFGAVAIAALVVVLS